MFYIGQRNPVFTIYTRQCLKIEPFVENIILFSGVRGKKEKMLGYLERYLTLLGDCIYMSVTIT